MSIANRSISLYAPVLCLCMLISACGNKGDLYLPQDAAAKVEEERRKAEAEEQ